MMIYLIRHAEAFPIGRNFSEDFERPLTPKGENQCKKIARFFETRKLEIEKWVCSPYLRTKQTTEQIVIHMGSDSARMTTESLAPEAEMDEAFKLIMQQNINCGIVGHEPLLGRLFQRMVSGVPGPGIFLSKASIVALEKQNNEWFKLRWHLSNKSLSQFFKEAG